MRQREFLQLQCFLGAAPLPGRPPRALPLRLQKVDTMRVSQA